jgi:hypothetical protein
MITTTDQIEYGDMDLQHFSCTDSSFDHSFLVPEEKTFFFQQSGHPDRPCGDGSRTKSVLSGNSPTRHSRGAILMMDASPLPKKWMPGKLWDIHTPQNMHNGADDISEI